MARKPTKAMLGKTVRVVWRDAGAHDGWDDPGEHDEWAEKPIRAGRTYGILHNIESDHLTVYGSDHGQRCHSLKIPLESVRQIVVWRDEPPVPHG